MKKFTLFFILIVSATILFISAGCKDVEEKDPNASPLPTATPGRELEPMLTVANDMDELVMPFWRLNTMYNESVAMIQREDGSITAKMLFKPTKIIEVRDNSLNKVYTEGVDYTWDGESNLLVWKEGSKIAYFTQNDLAGRKADGSLIVGWGDTGAGWSNSNPWDELGRSRFGNALYCIGSYLYDKQIAVTYEYEYGAWDGIVPEYQGDVLPNFMAKLADKNREDAVRVIYYGDSIFEGCDASAKYNRDPKQDSFPTLTRDYLRTYYGVSIRMLNPSVGGMDSLWGKDNADTLINRRSPDLVVIGFGMNDGGRQGTETAANVQSIIETIRATNPDCEFLVLSPMVPNADGGFLTTHGQLPDAYKALAGPGVAFIDMFNFHSKMLETKDFIAMSGNNINHPNDWLIRVYAMNILATLIDF